ncbi:MAG: hypothetical protein JSV89_11605 [Spirochaetaceae bacterium]|nr:MAG: hypothetical protein JSV89_11605 [Spirochaetaceae bacterium]
MYLFADAEFESLRQQAGMKEAISCCWGIASSGHKVLLHIGLGNKESYQSRAEFFRHTIARGLPMLLMVSCTLLSSSMSTPISIFRRISVFRRTSMHASKTWHSRQGTISIYVQPIFWDEDYWNRNAERRQSFDFSQKRAVSSWCMPL